MSAVTSFASLLMMPVPAWIVVFSVVGLYVIQYLSVVRRLESHGRSLGHMDRWANSVESRLERLSLAFGDETPPPVYRDRHPAAPANDLRRRPVDIRTMSDRQVRALLSRLVDERAA